MVSLNSEKTIRRGHSAIFGLLLLIGIFQLSLTAWLTSRYSEKGEHRNKTERDRVHFALFGSIWTVLGALFYMVLFFHSATGSILTSVASHLGYLALTWIIWTAGAGATTQLVGGGLKCKAQQWFAHCNQMNALMGFSWSLWILTTVLLIFVLARGITLARRGDGWRASLISGSTSTVTV